MAHRDSNVMLNGLLSEVYELEGRAARPRSGKHGQRLGVVGQQALLLHLPQLPHDVLWGVILQEGLPVLICSSPHISVLDACMVH